MTENARDFMNMNQYDSYREHLLAFPSELKLPEKGLAFAERLRGAKPDGVVVVGMGGSGLPGTFLESLAGTHRLPVPVMAWKDHGLPRTPFKKPLHLFMSFSGNTEETLSGLAMLLKKRTGRSIGVVTCGGKLKALAERHALPLALIRPTMDLTPREGIGYLYYNLLSLLRVVFPALAVQDCSHTIRAHAGERTGTKIAARLAKKVVLIYTSDTLAHVGQAWKTILNETAKQLAFANTYPEMGHNEIAALEATPFPVAAVFLDEKSDSPHARSHAHAIRKLITRQRILVIAVPLAGRTVEERTWHGVLLGHWTALAVARRTRVNPRSTAIIERLKKGI